MICARMAKHNKPSQLVTFVPSVLVPEAKNAVIDPMHPDFKRVSLKTVRELTFDSRMFKRYADELCNAIVLEYCARRELV